MQTKIRLVAYSSADKPAADGRRSGYFVERDVDLQILPPIGGEIYAIEPIGIIPTVQSVNLWLDEAEPTYEVEADLWQPFDLDVEDVRADLEAHGWTIKADAISWDAEEWAEIVG